MGDVMYAPERRKALLEIARVEGRVSVAEAAARFQVTTETIRRDLEALDRANTLRRVHGGAVPVESLDLGDIALAERDQAAVEEKDRIAHRAVEMLPESATATLILDAGSTTARMAALLPTGRWTVYTNSLPIATLLSARGDVDVHLLGGRVRGVTQAAVGHATVAALADIRADFSFVGTNGVSVDFGLSTPDADEAAVKAQMVESGRRVIILGDSRKIGAETTSRFAGLADVDALVTDQGIEPVAAHALEAHGLQVVRA